MPARKEGLAGTRRSRSISCELRSCRYVTNLTADPALCSRTFPDGDQEEEVREGFDPDNPEPHNPEQEHNLDAPFTVGEGEEDEDKAPNESEEAERWQHRDYDRDEEQEAGEQRISPQYASFHEERNAWGSSNDG